MLDDQCGSNVDDGIVAAKSTEEAESLIQLASLIAIRALDEPVDILGFAFIGMDPLAHVALTKRIWAGLWQWS